MPVTGEIAELPLPELLNMMRHRSGKLSLLQTQQISEMQLHFTPGYLCGFMVDKHIVKTETQVVDKLVSVTASPIGNFVFHPAHASSLMGSVRIQIDRLALIIVSQVDEISVNKEHMPAPHRIFRLQRPDGPLPDFEEASLADFYHSTVNLLKCGISAEKLASIERISAEQVQLYLYKLNILGLVAPTRRDDLWAQLDSVLQSKSTPLRLHPANNANNADNNLPRRVTARIWSPNRSAAGGHVTNKQREVSKLIYKPEEGEPPRNGAA